MARPARREQEVERAREAIVDAAARAFARHGFAAATMQDIADEAGYTVPTLYSYFKGKQAILDTLLDTVVTEFVALLERPLPDGLTLPQRLEIVLRDQLEWLDRRADACLTLMRDCGERSDEEVDGVALSARYYTSLFAEHADSEDLGGLDPEEAAFVLWGIVHGFFMRSVRDPSARPLAPKTRHIARLFFGGVRGASDGA